MALLQRIHRCRDLALVVYTLIASVQAMKWGPCGPEQPGIAQMMVRARLLSEAVECRDWPLTSPLCMIVATVVTLHVLL